MRLFVALRPSQQAVEHLDEFLDVRRCAAAFRWTRPEHLHVTLAFAGEAAERRVDDVAEALEAAVARHTPFDATVAGGGAFPDPDRAKVLWAGLESAGDNLERVAGATRTAFSTSGVEVDGKRFRPHLTVARCGRPTQVSDWVRLLGGYRGPVWTVGEIALVASYLGEGPRRTPRHVDLVTLPLGPATP